MREKGYVVLALLALVSCRTPAPDASIDSSLDSSAAPVPAPWPELPRTGEARRALIERETRRPVGDAGGDTESSLEALAGASLGRLEHAIAGEDAIRRWLDAWLERAGSRDAYVLFGTHHDSGGQIRAIRRLVAHPSRFEHVVMEQLVADGRWGALELAAQRGDDASLEGFLGTGDLGALEALTRAHAKHDYTAWKFDYAADVMDVVLSARATGRRVVPCDMPLGVRRGLAATPAEAVESSDQVNRLRELHCLFSLRERLARQAGPVRVAMEWGHDHVRASGLRRFLPVEARVLSIHLFGLRPGAPKVHPPHLVLNAPVLVPSTDASDPSELALWLPDERTQGDVDRVRTPRDATTEAPELRVTSDAPGVLTVTDTPGVKTAKLGGAEGKLALGAGDHTYVLRAGGHTFVGGFSLGPGERLTLTFDVAKRSTRAEHEARP